MIRCVVLFLVAYLFLGGCTGSGYNQQPRALRYEVAVEPDMSRIRITGSVNNLRKGGYYFGLPRTQGFPPAHFVKYVSFSDASGKLEAEVTDLGEWLIYTEGPEVTFTYHINLQQAMKYQREAWGGATTQLDENAAFINGSLSFMVPLIGNIATPVAMQWKIPEGWHAVTPWTADVDSLDVPSHYALVNNYYVAYKKGSMFRQRVRDLDLNTVWLGEGDINRFPDAAASIQKVVEAGLTFFGEDSSKEGITLILRDSNNQNRFRASTEANSIEFNFKRGMSFERIWKDYRDGFLRLLAHEIMHTWDRREVKEATNYLHVREWGINTCWMREGFTEYFAMLNLYRAGLRDLPDFVNTMQAISESAAERNSQGKYTLTNACRVFFVDDDALHFVYTGGAALAFYLDMNLRHETNGEKTLPALMREFMSAYRYKEKTIEAFIETWNAYAPPTLHTVPSHLADPRAVDISSTLGALGARQQPSSVRNRIYWQVPASSRVHTLFR